MQEAMVSLFRDLLVVCEEQGLLGGTHFALDGLTLSSRAAKEWSGTCADLRQKKAHLEEQGTRVLAEPPRAAQEGAPSCTAAQDNVREPIQRVEKPAARMENFLAENEPTRGTRGKEGHRNVTDNDSAQLQAAHGVLQGDKSQARAEARRHVIRPAATFGTGQDYGPVAPMLEGARANGKAMGLPAESFEGKLLSADRNDHRAAKLQTGVEETLDASIPAPHLRPRDPRVATPGRHTPPPKEKFTFAEVTSDTGHDGSGCPHDKGLQLAARRHKIGSNR